jgi:hypothetical protein
MNLKGNIPELLIRYSESLESSIAVDCSLVRKVYTVIAAADDMVISI